MTERVIFGLLIIVGYFATGWMAGFAPLDAQQRLTIRDILLTVGPILGMIAQAIWKTNHTESQQADTLNKLAERMPGPPVSGEIHFTSGSQQHDMDSPPVDSSMALDERGTGVGRAPFRATQPK